jgi:hypothetical protein
MHKLKIVQLLLSYRNTYHVGDEKLGKDKRLWHNLKSFLFGATTYDMVKTLEERKVLEEYSLMLVTLGDMFGYPISSFYRLRLLPFWFPRLESSPRENTLSIRRLIDDMVEDENV